MPMCDSDAAGSSPRSRSSALALTARRRTASDSPGVAGNVESTHALTRGSDSAYVSNRKSMLAAYSGPSESSR